MTVASYTSQPPSFSDATIKSALECADPMALRGLLYHATGDKDVAATQVEEVQWPFSVAKSVVDPADIALLRSKAFDLLKAYARGEASPPSATPDARLHKAISLAAGEHVPAAALKLHLDMLALDSRPKGWDLPDSARPIEDFNVVVIGTGFAGVDAAIQLKASKIPFTVLEKNAGVGGTWFKNTYPGARVDWPSTLYSHSYGVNFPFRYAFAPQQHNEEYLNWCVDQYNVRQNIEFETCVKSLIWDERNGVWEIESTGSDGTRNVHHANVVIAAIGLLERPFTPRIEGIDEFEGIAFHTSEFDHSIDYSDKRVVVIGTGASGMQMVPDLTGLARHITVFQRTPSWVFPAEGYREKLPAEAVWLNENFPHYRNWTRFVFSWNLGDHGLYDQFLIDPKWPDPFSINRSNAELREKLLDYMHTKLKGRPDLIEICTPDYPVFGTRPVIDNGWFDAIKSDKVTVISSGAKRVSAGEVISSDGERVPADVIIFATGFRPNEYFSEIHVTGRDGVDLQDIWKKDGPRAYWGIAVPKMPNLFLMYGPNANPANLGIVQYNEWAMAYFLQTFSTMMAEGWKSVEVSEAAFEKYNNSMDIRLGSLVSVSPRAHKSYYTNEYGRSAVQSPWRSREACEFFSEPDFKDYVIEYSGAARRKMDDIK